MQVLADGSPGRDVAARASGALAPRTLHRHAGTPRGRARPGAHRAQRPESPDRRRRRHRHLRLPPARARGDRRRARRPLARHGRAPREVDVVRDVGRRPGARDPPRHGRADRRRRRRGRRPAAPGRPRPLGPLLDRVRGRRHDDAARQPPPGTRAPRAGDRPPRPRRGRDLAQGLPRPRRPQPHAGQGADHGPGRPRRRRQPAGRRGALARADRPATGGADDLSEKELDRLRVAIRAATRSAIAGGGVHTGKVIPARRRDGVCPRCGTAMARGTIGGRTTYWCPAEQV